MINTKIIVKTLTSRQARKVYKTVAKGGAKLAASVTGEVVTYFAAHKIIKAISKQTNFEPAEPATIRFVNVPAEEAEA